LYTTLQTTYSKTLYVAKYHYNNVIKMIFCLLGKLKKYKSGRNTIRLYKHKHCTL